MFVAAVKFCSYSTIHIILMYNILLGAVSEISNIFTGATFCCTSHGLETAHTEVSCLFFLCTIFFDIKHFLNIVNGVNVYMQHGAVGRASDS